MNIIIRNFCYLLVPTKPLNLRASNVTSQQLNVSWSEPERRNGILTGYTIYYKLLRNDRNDIVPGTTEREETTKNNPAVELKNLGKSLNYFPLN